MARSRRTGQGVALGAMSCWSPGVRRWRRLAAAQRLEGDGVDAAVLDLRWIAPLDEGALSDAARDAGGRVLIVHEAVRTAGFGAELIARLHELAPAPSLYVERITTPDIRMPASPALQAVLVPDESMIVQRVRDLLGRSRAD